MQNVSGPDSSRKFDLSLFGKRDEFLTQMSRWVLSIPVNSMFLVHIENIPKQFAKYLEQTNMDKLEKMFNDGNKDQNYINPQVFFNGENVLFLTQKCSLPIEDAQVKSSETLGGLGMMQPFMFSEGRQWSFLDSGIDIEFLETNLSFVDFVLRPWAITMQTRGLIADRNSEEKVYKTTITVYEFSKSLSHIKNGIVRKEWTFKNAHPVNVQTYSLNMQPSNTVIQVSQKWQFSEYDVSTTKDVIYQESTIEKERSKMHSQKTVNPGMVEYGEDIVKSDTDSQKINSNDKEITKKYFVEKSENIVKENYNDSKKTAQYIDGLIDKSKTIPTNPTKK